MNRFALLLALVATLTACDRGGRTSPQADGTPDEQVSGQSSGPSGQTLNEGWQEPGTGRIDVRRERPFDLTGDGDAERVIATARGPRYDSLDITLHIADARGDTLWLESWSSATYFKYDPLQGKADSTVARIVRAHVDSLVHESRFGARGLPAALRRGDATGSINESIRYHLAELDYRGRASLEARDPTPADSYDRISAATVVPERVQAVRQELEAGPTFMYYAGGEATYAIGWSAREHSFVRLYACC
jgi:hypothetical protein